MIYSSSGCAQECSMSDQIGVKGRQQTSRSIALGEAVSAQGTQYGILKEHWYSVSKANLPRYNLVALKCEDMLLRVRKVM